VRLLEPMIDAKSDYWFTTSSWISD